jgi:hypothetical protein
MTLPYEEVNSIKETRKFLVELMTWSTFRGSFKA